MQEGLLDAWLTNEAGAKIARVGALVSSPSEEGKVFAVTALAPMLSRKVETLFWNNEPVGAYRRMTIADCPSPEIRDTCVLIELNSTLSETARHVKETLSQFACPLERCFREKVRLYGTEFTGIVHMRRRPVHYAMGEHNALLSETMAIKFDHDIGVELSPGRLIVGDALCEPLGIAIGGTWDYCLVAPVALLVSGGRLKLGHREPASVEIIQFAAEKQLELVADDSGWNPPIPDDYKDAA